MIQTYRNKFTRYRTSALQDVGIAGIRDFTSVKCLHCHYAHFLARPEHNNLIGKWTHEQLLLLNATSTVTENGDDVVDSVESELDDVAER